MILKRNLLKKLIHGVANTNPEEIGCDECYQQLDQFAEMVLEGKQAAEAMPLVEDHLQKCGDCHQEFTAFLDALKAIRNMNGHET